MSMAGRPVKFRVQPVRSAMAYDEALRLLELKPTYDVATIKAAFARRCKVFHPDTAGEPLAAWMTLPGNEGYSMERLKMARDVLLEAAAALNRTCKLCRGAGMVHGAMGSRKCSACDGTGDKK